MGAATVVGKKCSHKIELCWN